MQESDDKFLGFCFHCTEEKLKSCYLLKFEQRQENEKSKGYIVFCLM